MKVSRVLIISWCFLVIGCGLNEKVTADNPSSLQEVGRPIIGDMTDSDTDLEMKRMVARVYDELRRGNPIATDELKPYRGTMIRYIAPYLTDPDWEIRCSAARYLGNTRDTNAIMPLMDALADTDHNVNIMTIEELYKLHLIGLFNQIDTTLVIPQLLSYAGSGKSHTDYAVLILGQIGNPSVIPEIIKLQTAARNKNSYWAAQLDRACIAALARLGDPGTNVRIAEMLQSDSPVARAFACQYIEYTGDHRWGEYLLPMLEDKREAIDAGEWGMVRVCDVAATAIMTIFRPKVSFSSTFGEFEGWMITSTWRAGIWDNHLREIKDWMAQQLTRD